jgi:hypothetical protein
MYFTSQNQARVVAKDSMMGAGSVPFSQFATNSGPNKSITIVDNIMFISNPDSPLLGAINLGNNQTFFERNDPEYRFRKMVSEDLGNGEYNIYGAGQVGDYLYKVNFDNGQESFTTPAEGFKPSGPVTNVKINGNTLLINSGNLTRLYNKNTLEDYWNVTITGAQNTVANLDSSKISV